ncbi:hypothetical protein GCM10027425_33520 [Alteromonas gracilis]
MPRSPAALAALLGPLLLLGFVLAVPLVIAPAQDECNPTVPAGMRGSLTARGTDARRVGSWDREQLLNAAKILQAGKALGVPARAQLIAVMTAMGESGLRVLDYGDDVGPDSRGLFQQRDNGAWGSYADRMDPIASATSFYRALLRVPGWHQLTPTLAAHRTQRNADPNHYARWWPEAVEVVEAITKNPNLQVVETATATGVAADCGDLIPVVNGTVAMPVDPGSGYIDRRNWGASAAVWTNGHTGTDFSVACGTAVRAATSGVVLVETDQAWSGRWLVKVQSAGPGSLTTWYAHMQDISVRQGQIVRSGQRLGDVGAEGNSTGCHLHFEVHPRGGSIYEDNIDPSAWLKANLGKTLSREEGASS